MNDRTSASVAGMTGVSAALEVQQNRSRQRVGHPGFPMAMEIDEECRGGDCVETESLCSSPRCPVA